MRGLTTTALDERLLAWTRGAQGEDTFAGLALDVYRYQYAHNAPYRRWCDGRAGTPDVVHGWRDIPAVPQSAFKEWTLATFAVADAVARFDSSGTTQGTPSRHYLDTLTLYDAAVVAPFRHFVLPDDAELGCLALVPAPEDAPHSSLAHMAGVVGRACFGGRITFFVRDDRLDIDGVVRACDEAAASVCLFTTAFALVHLLDAMDASGRTLTLPPGSRVMETGGYKGRTRELPKAELHAWASDRFGLPQTHIVNEYGMAELSSQWYDTILADKLAGRTPEPRRKVGPPWVRARVLDPVTGEEARVGAVGIIRLYDPMNRSSVCCIQTEDLGRQLEAGFEVLGRATDAELRGCSLDLDTF